MNATYSGSGHKCAEHAITLAKSEDTYSDIDEQASLLPGYDQTYRQVSMGQYEGTFCSLQAQNNYSIYLEQTNRVLAQQGGVPAGCFSVGVLLDSSTPCRIDSMPLHKDGVFLQCPGVEYDFVTSEDMSVCVVTIPQELMPGDITNTSHLPSTAIISADQKLVRSISLFVRASVDRFRDNPAILDNSEIVVAFQSTLSSMISWYLTLCLQRDEPSRAGNPAGNLALFRRAREYMFGNLQRTIMVDDVCAHLQVSRRTLEYCFAKACGVSPARYLKMLKMNEIRRELLMADNDVERVGDVAARWNVWSLGRFAGDYLTLFGERPSDTVRRRPR